MSRHFTLTEARALLGFARRTIAEAVKSKDLAEQSETWLRELSQKILMSGGVAVDTAAVEIWKTQYDTSTQALKSAMEALDEAGIQVKDLDVGLIDFPTIYRGEEVLLCFRMDESDITHWHGMTEGFAGRKEIDEDFVRNHRGQTLT